MLEGLDRKLGAIDVLQSVEAYFRDDGASCKLNTSSFTVDVTAISDAKLKSESQNCDRAASCDDVQEAPGLSCLNLLSDNLSFRVSVFQQTPGTLLVKGSLQQGHGHVAGAFSTTFQRCAEILKQKFCREK